jgi:16S rRNA (guanine527-N7)-methyltransferase
LVVRYGLGDTACAQLGTLAHRLADPDAPTTVRGAEAIADDHLADALVALELDEVRAATRIADLGSGTGIPGLALAIALPEARVWLVESNRRKCEFIARTATACGLGNADAVCVRVEEWAEGRGRCDLVVARALASLPVVAEYAAPLLRAGGALVAWRGRIDPGEESVGRATAGELGLRYEPPRPVKPYPRAAHRHLQRMIKVAPTPARFPRRAGMARKRPLGGAA